MGIVTSASSVQNRVRCTEGSTRQPYKGTCQDLPEAGGSATVHLLPPRVSFPDGAKEFQGSDLADIWTPAGDPTQTLQGRVGGRVPKAAPGHGRGHHGSRGDHSGVSSCSSPCGGAWHEGCSDASLSSAGRRRARGRWNERRLCTRRAAADRACAPGSPRRSSHGPDADPASDGGPVPSSRSGRAAGAGLCAVGGAEGGASGRGDFSVAGGTSRGDVRPVSGTSEPVSPAGETGVSAGHPGIQEGPHRSSSGSPTHLQSSGTFAGHTPGVTSRVPSDRVSGGPDFVDPHQVPSLPATLQHPALRPRVFQEGGSQEAAGGARKHCRVLPASSARTGSGTG